jgi:hypothetical protein
MVSELAQKAINKRPYLETKIVTYVNNPGDDGIEIYYTDKPLQGKYKCRENIDRIKLPCYCTFEWRGKRRLGKVENVAPTEMGISNGHSLYVLSEIDRQTNQQVGNTVDAKQSLKKLIRKYKINIGKVKLTYYETI